MRTAAVCVFPASALDAIKALKDLNARDKIEVASGMIYICLKIMYLKISK